MTKTLNSQVNFKVYLKKIDIYLRNKKGYWFYECSTKAYKTCTLAKHAFCVRHSLNKSQVKCLFAK